MIPNITCYECIKLVLLDVNNMLAIHGTDITVSKLNTAVDCSFSINQYSKKITYDIEF